MDEPTPGAEPETEAGTETGTRPGAEAEAGPGTGAGSVFGPAGEPPVPDHGPRPLGVHVTPTGHLGVDAGLRRLADADHLAVTGHPEVYEDVHRGLRDTLTALDQRPGPPAPGVPHDSGS